MNNQYYKYEITKNVFPHTIFTKGDTFIVYVYKDGRLGKIIEAHHQSLIGLDITPDSYFWVDHYRKCIYNQKEIERLNKKRLLMEI